MNWQYFNFKFNAQRIERKGSHFLYCWVALIILKLAVLSKTQENNTSEWREQWTGGKNGDTDNNGRPSQLERAERIVIKVTHEKKQEQDKNKSIKFVMRNLFVAMPSRANGNSL